MKTIDFYGSSLPVWKTNLHTHSTVSDGKLTPREVVELYRKNGYDVLAFSDHRRTNAVSELDGGGMLLLSGIELHPAGPRGILWHLLATGVPENFTYGENDGAQTLIDSVVSSGGVCFAAHPYWCGLTSAEVMSLQGLAGLEVFNASTVEIGKPFNMQLWDEILDTGRLFHAIAVDDLHTVNHAFQGWTMIAAAERTAPAILSALRAGNFYASQGPEIHRLHYENGIFSAEFTPCRSAILMSNRNCGYGLTDGEFTSLRADVSSWPRGNYLRLQLTDSDGKLAWSNPLPIGN